MRWLESIHEQMRLEREEMYRRNGTTEAEVQRALQLSFALCVLAKKECEQRQALDQAKSLTGN